MLSKWCQWGGGGAMGPDGKFWYLGCNQGVYSPWCNRPNMYLVRLRGRSTCMEDCWGARRVIIKTHSTLI